MDCIEFSANKDGSVKIERKIAGVVSDRINVVKGGNCSWTKYQTWRPAALFILNQPSAGIVIQVPPIPPLQLSQADRLEAFEAAIDQHNLEHDNQESGSFSDTIPEDANSRLAIALAAATWPASIGHSTTDGKLIG